MSRGPGAGDAPSATPSAGAHGGPVFDAHFHIIDPRFPLRPSEGFAPELFLVEDYRAQVAGLGVVGGALVSGSFQGFDQRYLASALPALGPGFVGVTQLPADVPDAEVRRLDALGVRAVRFNLCRGGSAPLEDLERLARRVHDLCGWHVELYVDGRELAGLAPRLRALPRVVVDHLGLCREGLPALVRLAERGVRVKASGFGRGDLEVPLALRALFAADPAALVFGSDLPSTRAPRPFRPEDLTLIGETLGEAGSRRVLHDNAVALYRPAAVEG